MMSTEQKTTQITQPGTAKSVPVEIAQEYLAAGLSVLPASRQKKHPVLKAWTEYQTRLPEEQEVKKWFSTRRDALCVVCGKVSGNLEVIDFDNHGELYDAWKTFVPEELLSRLVIERSQSGGFHVTYRCENEICGNLKLAVGMRDDRRTTLIETRGEGRQTGLRRTQRQNDDAYRDARQRKRHPLCPLGRLCPGARRLAQAARHHRR